VKAHPGPWSSNTTQVNAQLPLHRLTVTCQKIAACLTLYSGLLFFKRDCPGQAITSANEDNSGETAGYFQGWLKQSPSRTQRQVAVSLRPATQQAVVVRMYVFMYSVARLPPRR